jgi:rSAM/selenodomain-associated transferase 1
MKTSNQLLIIFTKNPLLGKVKTRLAETLGEEQTLAVFRRLLAQAAKVAKSWDGDVWIFYADFIPKDDVWASIGCRFFLQQGGDLGTRMAHAFDKGFARYDKVVLMGTDIPDISTEIVDNAFELLSAKDFVLGPTFDGGYYLVGMKAMHYFVFRQMTWSTSDVLAQTLKRIQDKPLSVALTKPLIDIDYEADLTDFPWLLTDS